MKSDILIIVEHWNGQVDGITYQILTKGRELADSIGAGLAVLILGHGLEETVSVLKNKGMDEIFVIDNPALAQAGPEVQSQVIAEAVRRLGPRLVLIGYTIIGMELTPAIATKLGITPMTNCVKVELADGAFVVTRPLFDGTLHAKIVLEEKGPSLVALQRGATPAAELPSKQASVEPIQLDIGAIPARSQFLGFVEDPVTGADITKAEVIVSVGRGIADKEKIATVEQLADALGGMLACSRPLVDLGWLPRERQVGASGKSVAPKVYIACGISGASQHLSGMTESQRIIAINKDANAPIFQVAHYGVVGDLFEIVPALTEEAKKSK
ncbi:MAG: electron transfer flavoprotein subunit alpha/FixB family protein [Deltaproteobacteria bacterium]|nr:electron transfer flavoprotein subunit alpha/FixB family protein [Deltaproteobacteria bacterium]